MLLPLTVATTSCGRRAVGEVNECDTVQAQEMLSSVFGAEYARSETNVLAVARFMATHRQAAEKATLERDAGIADAHRQARLKAAKNALSRKVKAEARDHESMAIEAMHIATAIRSQNDG